MRYRTLGTRTGLRVSEIGFGGYPIRDPEVLRHARDLGINYVDTSDDYRDGDSERAIGRALEHDRKRFVLTTKIHPWGGTKKAEMATVATYTSICDQAAPKLTSSLKPCRAKLDEPPASG